MPDAEIPYGTLDLMGLETLFRITPPGHRQLAAEERLRAGTVSRAARLLENEP